MMWGEGGGPGLEASRLVKRRGAWVVAIGLVMSLSLVPAVALGGAAAKKPKITEFKLPGPAAPWEIIRGADGNIWFVEDLEYSEHSSSKIGRITPSGHLTLYSTPHSGVLQPITRGPDGNAWFIEGAQSTYLGKITSHGVITEVPVSGGGSDMALGSDGNFWSTGGNAIDRITPTGAVRAFRLKGTRVPRYITRGPDGNMWFTVITIAYRDWHYVGRITPTGKITLFRIPTFDAIPEAIASGPDHSLWFAENHGGKIGRISTSGKFKEFRIPYPDAHPLAVVAGPDGNVWFTDSGTEAIGRITPSGKVKEFAVPRPPTPGALEGLAVGKHRTLWYTEQYQNPHGFGMRGRIGRVQLPK